MLLAHHLFEPIVVGVAICHRLIVVKIKTSYQTSIVAMRDKTREILKRTLWILAPEKMKAQGLKFARCLPLYLDASISGLDVEAD